MEAAGEEAFSLHSVQQLAHKYGSLDDLTAFDALETAEKGKKHLFTKICNVQNTSERTIKRSQSDLAAQNTFKTEIRTHCSPKETAPREVCFGHIFIPAPRGLRNRSASPS
ncbi:hypothetical protein [Paenibacillus albidus]|uniref:hypothetical protein n=1 Tax=Paenibacillus albidus TaxID=2041023 RepID=UPI00166AFB1E|nr:hypothetical protein [Paenibacillus albidus]